ncbi:helix-turn-helix transcriptional regulator [bacterium]|nr:helix-turn-helix transcriptional regulator [bacterium]
MSIQLNQYKMIPDHPVHYQLSSKSIHILFTVDETLSFNIDGNRTMPLPAASHYLFYEQEKNFKAIISGPEGAGFITLTIPISELHHLLSSGNDELNFEAAKTFESGSYHRFDMNSGNVAACLESIGSTNNPLLLESKKFELLGYLFAPQDVKTYKCPFLNQKENVQKVRDAKAKLIEDLQEAPTIKELSKEVGLNEYNLKTGFKEIYGKPIYTYLKDYRINQAQKMLDKKQYQVNEIAEMVGYSNVSHFIDAFKKKYGLTPKQYVLNQK